ncbi:MAG: hypothetical protein JNK82_00560 [Myxococcaceae bacterium]|nr:hypothetical protein [Myxococcaceae bacterium]
MNRRLLLVFALCAPAAGLAMPVAPRAFCAKYPTAPACTGVQLACSYCHSSPPGRNTFGAVIEAQLLPGTPRPLTEAVFEAALPNALAAVESNDSDGDGVTNLVEIQRGTLPAEKKSYPNDIPCAGGTNPRYDVCKYDTRYVYKKVLLDFCGAQPTWEQLETFLAAADKPAAIDAALDGCLQSEFWRGKNGQLWEIAHKKIRPVGSLKRGEDQVPGTIFPIFDYYADYAMFTYTQLDNRDAREVLTAKYLVQRTAGARTTYAQVQNIFQENCPTNRRAGLLTTNWNLGYNVMFTALPRNAASQAYRSFLGLDIAKQEGLYPISSEPRDFDGKGVQQDLCKQCHQTLDPLSYPWKNYNGLTGDFQEWGSYLPNRITRFFAGEAPNIGMIPESGYILGQPVSDLVQWARVAADSDPFAINTVMDYWKLTMGGPPTPEQNAEFVKLWRDFKGPLNYGVDNMLHALVKTEAYGAP